MEIRTEIHLPTVGMLIYRSLISFKDVLLIDVHLLGVKVNPVSPNLIYRWTSKWLKILTESVSLKVYSISLTSVVRRIV